MGRENERDRSILKVKSMITITVNSRIEIAGIDEDVKTWLMKQFTHSNPAFFRAKASGRKWTTEKPKIMTWSYRGESLTVPRGGMDTVRQCMNKFDLDYTVVDKRCTGATLKVGSYVDPWQFDDDLFPHHKLAAWEHQTGLIESIKKYNQVLALMPTGSGKTSALIGAIAELQVPALVIMWETGILRQWQQRIKQELGIEIEDQGLIQGKVCKLKPITLAMQQTLHRWNEAKWKQLDGVFGLVACDEVQRYAASTFTTIVDRFDAKYRVGLSANIERKDKKQFLITDVFGAARYEVDKQTLIDRGIIHNVEVYVVPTDFRANWYVENREAGLPADVDFNTLLDEMQNNVKRNALIGQVVKDCVDQDLPTLVFAHRVDHCTSLDADFTRLGIKSSLALGGDDRSAQFDETIDGLRDRTLQVGVGTFQKLGTGHDVPTVAAGVAATPVHSNKSFMEQVKGRICRTSEGKLNARIYVMWDQHVFANVPLFNLKKWNKVVRVWNITDRRWMDVLDYLTEKKAEHETATEKQTGVSSIFKSGNR